MEASLYHRGHQETNIGGRTMRKEIYFTACWVDEEETHNEWTDKYFNRKTVDIRLELDDDTEYKLSLSKSDVVDLMRAIEEVMTEDPWLND